MQEKYPLVELIRHEMKRQKIRQIDLVRLSGVAQPVVSRLMSKKEGDKNVGVDNIYRILISLGLIRQAGMADPNRVIDLQRRRYDSVRAVIKKSHGIDVERAYHDILSVESQRERDILVDLLQSLAEKARQFRRRRKSA